MATKGSSKTTSAPTRDTDALTESATQWATLLDASRQQVAFGSECFAQLLAQCSGAGLVNQHMLERASLMHRQAAESIRGALTQEEVLAVQANLLATSWQDALRYWQELMLSGARAVASNAPQAAAPRAAAPGDVAAAALNAAAPVMKAWQSMFTVPLNGATATH